MAIFEKKDTATHRKTFIRNHVERDQLTKMKKLIIILISLMFCFNVTVTSQAPETLPAADSVKDATLNAFNNTLEQLKLSSSYDSLRKLEIAAELLQLKSNDAKGREALESQLRKIESREKQSREQKKIRIDSLRKTTIGFPVIDPLKDTLFMVFARAGASQPHERAVNISRKIAEAASGDFFHPDSIKVVAFESTYDVMLNGIILTSISENDAIWYGKSMIETALDYQQKIKTSISKTREDQSLGKIAKRTALVLLILFIVWFFVFLVRKGDRKLNKYLEKNQAGWLKDLSYKDYTILTAEQEMMVILFIAKLMRWFIYAVFIYIALSLIFSIFPFSRDWADTLVGLVLRPLKQALSAVWEYMPNLFSILVIFFLMKYVIRFTKYIFHEIEQEKLKIAGFHADWAMPTYGIVRVLLYAFMLVLVFPYLPGSDSNIFKGVSVFIGILFSLGSSSVITNMVAGIVITYMRPFKIGDRVKIGDVTGVVVEKTLLVSRIMTIKNEIITIPNSSVLSGNTVNYSSEAAGRGLITHTTVTIGYDVPWKKMHEALLEAALRTDFVQEEPKPFVLQTGLEDFYVSYQLNVYIKNVDKLALINSGLHQNIQDVCNERGIEILSPHYRAARDGNSSTIPADYLPPDYQPPGFEIRMKKD
jgi:small-conductance mechanosensitive channel